MWRKILKWLGGLAIPAIGWIVAPIIKARLEGSPLNGLPGIIQFWKQVAMYPLPVWFLVLALLAVSAIVIAALKLRKKPQGKADLRVVVLPTPEPRWGIAASGKTPTLNLTFHANLAHRAEGSLQIIKAYLEGTEPAFPFLPIVVAGPYDEPQVIHLGVRPIIARHGKSLKRRVILVDQFGEKHRTEAIAFHPTVNDLSRFRSGASEIGCIFCGKPIAIEDMSESSHVPAHRKCVK